ncbi:hypothetical protein FRB98_008080 [Tulasnella sp. 332]|nr:hypothetical protein FRB98_008080 [Tulasnella sp. 332]
MSIPPHSSELGSLKTIRNPSSSSILSRGSGNRVATGPITVRRRVVVDVLNHQKRSDATSSRAKAVSPKAGSQQPSRSSSGSSEINPENRRLIACRMISTDQWLTTHVDASWTVRFTKIYLLIRSSKQQQQQQQHRTAASTSSATFASSAQYLYPASPYHSTPIPSPSTSISPSPTTSKFHNHHHTRHNHHHHHPHSRSNTDSTIQSSFTRSTGTTSITSDDLVQGDEGNPGQHQSGSGGESSRASSNESDCSDVVFAQHLNDESCLDDDDDDFDYGPPLAGSSLHQSRRPLGLHQKNLPRRTKSETLNLGSIGRPPRSLTATASLTLTSTGGASQSLMYDSKKLASSAPKLGNTPIPILSNKSSSVSVEDASKRLDEYMKRKAIELSADGYVICSFSTGQTLDEHLTLEALRIRPGEMLEIHRRYARIHLPRMSYELSYFDAPALVHASKEKVRKGHHHHTEHGSSRKSSFERGLLNGLQPQPQPQTQLKSAPSQQSSFAAATTGSETQPQPHHSKHPYRSASTHFKKSSSDRALFSSAGGTHGRGGSNSSSFIAGGGSDERWREQQHDGYDVTESNGGFLPPALADNGPLAFASLPGIGSPRRKDSLGRSWSSGAEGKTSPVASTDEAALKAKNWKNRWIVIREGRVLMMGRDKLLNPQHLEHFDLADLRSVQESSVPVSLRRQNPQAVNTCSVTVTWCSKSSGNAAQTDMGASVTRFWLFDAAVHDHLLRILSCALTGHNPKSTKMQRSFRDPPSFSNGVHSSLPSRLMGGASSISSQRHLDPRSPSRASAALSDTLSLSSVEDDDNASDAAGASRQPLKPRPQRLHSSRNVRSVPGTPPTDTESESDCDPAFQSLNNTCLSLGRKQSRRMSLTSAIRLGPPEVPSPVVKSGWREILLSRCVAAGRGDAVLMGKHIRVACSPWQVAVKNGQTMFDVEGAGMEDLGMSPMDDDTESEYEWENWRREVSYGGEPEAQTTAQQVAARQSTYPTPGPFGPFPRNYTIPLSPVSVFESRKSSLPTIMTEETALDSIGDAPQPFPGTTAEAPPIEESKTVRPPTSVGRARSRSAATVKQTPDALAPIDTTTPKLIPDRHGTSPSPSPISPFLNGTDRRRTTTLLSTASSNSKRSRSSTIAVGPSASTFSINAPSPPILSSPPSPKPPPSPNPSTLTPVNAKGPSLARGISQRNEEVMSDDSDMSLTAALDAGPPRPLEAAAKGEDSTATTPRPLPKSRRPGTAELAASALEALASLNPNYAPTQGQQSKLKAKKAKSKVAPLVTPSPTLKVLQSPTSMMGRPRSATRSDVSYAQSLKGAPTTPTVRNGPL